MSRSEAKKFIASSQVNLCYVGLKRRLNRDSVKVEQCGDDEIHTFSDGSKVQYRPIVKEFVLFKG